MLAPSRAAGCRRAYMPTLPATVHSLHERHVITLCRRSRRACLRHALCHGFSSSDSNIFRTYCGICGQPQQAPAAEVPSRYAPACSPRVTIAAISITPSSRCHRRRASALLTNAAAATPALDTARLLSGATARRHFRRASLMPFAPLPAPRHVRPSAAPAIAAARAPEFSSPERPPPYIRRRSSRLPPTPPPAHSMPAHRAHASHA